ncbi:transcriptional regulator [Pseudoxanthomonas sp. GM95]|uniref:helix-turn-helix transcriptional regulator n=1 Tax=Pseudoxanthomonas sp. GM95 TaxID=1881043 RepID=UPI0008C37A35|nr:helix-turn-helix transcriptional regulator [Pseudoxanthomonas sp. GM95]SEL14838.1 transcriptional regulator [Pseudoxanthomonas sp. GM95]
MPIRDAESFRQLRDALSEDIEAGRLDIPEAVRRMRNVTGMTQVEFAKKLGIAELTLKQIERGKGNPTLATLQSLGKIFGLSVGFVKMPAKSAI